MSTGDTRGKQEGEARDPLDRDQLLRQAVEAAAASDLKGVLHAIQQSEVFDGFLRRLCGRWSSLHETDLSAVLWTEVIDAFVEAVRRADRIGDVAHWLWRVAWVKTYDLHRAKRRERPVGGVDVAAPEPSEHVVWDDGEDERAKRVKKAIELARGLLPRLGEMNVQLVMGYIFDAYAAGRWEVSNEEIADALGKSSEYVRQWRSRGFRRLVREAKQERLVNPDFDISQFEQEPGGQGEQVDGQDDD
jgi:DNA-directed RNA polymerase specialized sigma24 family protein